MSDTEAFEKWISQPPYEKPTDLTSLGSVWKGQYKAYEVQLAYEAWQAALEFERQSKKAISEANDRMVWGD
jgi:hypothetical protein